MCAYAAVDHAGVQRNAPADPAGRMHAFSRGSIPWFPPGSAAALPLASSDVRATDPVVWRLRAKPPGSVRAQAQPMHAWASGVAGMTASTLVTPVPFRAGACSRTGF